MSYQELRYFYANDRVRNICTFELYYVYIILLKYIYIL